MRKRNVSETKADSGPWDFTRWLLLALLIVGIALAVLAAWPRELDTEMKEHFDIEHK